MAAAIGMFGTDRPLGAHDEAELTEAGGNLRYDYLVVYAFGSKV
jgi:hypothetical protein